MRNVTRLLASIELFWVGIMSHSRNDENLKTVVNFLGKVGGREVGQDDKDFDVAITKSNSNPCSIPHGSATWPEF